MQLQRAVLLVIGLLALVACGGTEPGDTAGTETTTTTAETTTTVADTTSTTAGDGEKACSAAGLDVDLVDQPDLPEVVAATRRDIAEVATDCDYDVLADIAQRGGDEFTYSFGDAGHPADFWRREEAAGREPLRFLVELLDRPYGLVEDDGMERYAWPSAFTTTAGPRSPKPTARPSRPCTTRRTSPASRPLAATSAIRW